MTVNFDKFKALVHYAIHSAGSKENVGKTVIYKILYFSDFDFYETHEKFLTGERYARLPQGPAPRDFDKAIKQLKVEGKIQEINSNYRGKKQIKFLSIIPPNLQQFTAEEMALVDRTIQKISSMNATQASAYSHMDIPWKSAKDKEDLDYEMVFYRDATYSVREYEDDV